MSSSTSNVVSILDGLPLRLAKAQLADDYSVEELKFLASYLYVENPEQVPKLIRHIRLLAPDAPPFDGLDLPGSAALTVVPPAPPSPRAQRTQRAHDWSAAAHVRSVDAKAQSAAARARMLDAKHKMAG